MYKVPDLDKDRKCPACVSFAVALRKASWEAHPPHIIEQRPQRKKLLNSDERCQELLTEAMDVVLTRQAFVYFVPGSVPPTDREDLWREGANDHILLYFNKTDAPKNAIGRFWSLQDLYLHRRLQVADFQKIAQTLERNADQSLMHFMHDELRETLGDETEALCYLDLFQSGTGNKDDYVNEPIGLPGLRDFSQEGKPFDLEADWLTLNILKNRTKDELQALEWAHKLCKSKELCGREAEKKSKSGGGGSKKGNNKVKNYIHSVFPIHPPKVEAKDFSDDPDKSSGIFEAPQDRPLGQAVDPEEMKHLYDEMKDTGVGGAGNDDDNNNMMNNNNMNDFGQQPKRTITINGKGGDETPLMMDEEY